MTLSSPIESQNEGQSAKRENSLVRGILIGAAIGALIFLVYAGSYIVWLRLSYPDLKVTADQWSTVNIDGVTYGFQYQPSSPYKYQSNYGVIARSVGQNHIIDLAAREGSVSVMHPLRITVREVRPEYVVLSIEHLDG